LIRENRTSGTNNPEAKVAAKGALGLIHAYVRLRATLANEKTNELVERRLLLSEESIPRRQLTA
jgi:hypothetical protein